MVRWLLQIATNDPKFCDYLTTVTILRNIPKKFWFLTNAFYLSSFPVNFLAPKNSKQ